NIRVKEGDKLSVGGVILSLEEAAGGTSTATAAAPAAAKKTPKPITKKVQAEPEPEEEEEAEAGEAEIVNENPVAPPSVRKVAHELGIDLHKVPGDESGRVTWEDLRNWLARLERLAAQKKSAKP